MARILSIDFGHVRIGLAISDPLGLFATPLENVKGSKNPQHAASNVHKALETLIKAKGWEVFKIIVGLPIHLDGSESERSAEVRSFAQTLESLINIPVELFDERMTTVQAERALLEGNVSRKKRTQSIDSVSSIILLQSFLDLQARKIQ